MKIREWAVLVGGILILAGGAAWAIAPSKGEKALYQAAMDCGVDNSFIYYVRDQTDRSGRLIGVEYSTDGYSQDFDCLQRQLRNKGIRPNIGQEIDAKTY